MAKNKGWTPESWASWTPFGLGHQRPNNYAEVFRAIRENSDNLGYAWKILNHGVCDGCALGTSGIRDWTLDGVHLCNIRLRLLRLNTAPAFSPDLLQDLGRLMPGGKLPKAADLRERGRLAYPMIRRKGERGFRRLDWEEAMNLMADRIRVATARRFGVYMTSRGIPNEMYYAVQKAVRAIGTNSIDNAARLCHAPSTVGLKSTLGVAATTCSYKDWLESDLIVFIGSNVANNQPVATKYLHFAKKNGAKIAVINSYREPGMENYWIPSIVESALFGTKIADRFFLINIGGDIAFLNGVLKHIVENKWHDPEFVAGHTHGFAELQTATTAMSWTDLEQFSGATRETMLEFAQMIQQAKRAVFVWSMGITQHEFGADGVRAIVNLALTKGFVGRAGCGVMPIRGHSGVQGGAEMGAYATVYPGGRAITPENAKWLEEQWGFAVPTTPGWTGPEMIDAAHKGELDVLFSIGGNFLDVLPEPAYVETALARVPLRVHMDIVLSPQMLIDPADTVILLPAMTRYEVPGGVTQTSTERRVIFSPQIRAEKFGETRSEAHVLLDLAQRIRPELKDRLGCEDMDKIRAEIARMVPFYDGIQHLHKKGDQFQYGGPHLCADWRFPTPDGRARFSVVHPPKLDLSPDIFLMGTRRGKQFNSMIHENKDALNGSLREAVLMNGHDMTRLGLKSGEKIILRNNISEMCGYVFPAQITPGNIMTHWPESNGLIRRDSRAADAGIPNYNAHVTVEKA